MIVYMHILTQFYLYADAEGNVVVTLADLLSDTKTSLADELGSKAKVTHRRPQGHHLRRHHLEHRRLPLPCLDLSRRGQLPLHPHQAMTKVMIMMAVLRSNLHMHT
jgi:hypothetical protein